MFYKISIRITALTTMLAFISCEKKEIPITRVDRGDVISNQLDLGLNYKNQIWFKLKTNTIVTTNSKIDWDLAISFSADGASIYLNTAKVMRAAKTNLFELVDVVDTVGYQMNVKADSPTGNKDSLALSNWQINQQVYCVNLGYNEENMQLGFFKLKIINSTSNSITLRYSPINSTTYEERTIFEDPSYNRIMFSLSSGITSYIEPIKENFDLCFTQYTHIFNNPHSYYQVTGVLNNSYKTRITKISSKAFNDVVLSDTSLGSFSSNENVIGYDWKTFDFTNNTFIINSDITYIIQDPEGFFYKLHFTDFYNALGIKGFPKFEFRKL